MKSAILAFVTGVFLLQLQAQLWTWQSSLFAALVAAACLVFCHVSSQFVVRKRWPGVIAIPTALLRLTAYGLLGFCWAGFFAVRALQTELPAEWESRDVDVVGVVDSLPFRSEQGSSFQFAVEKYTPVEAGADAAALQNFSHRLVPRRVYFKTLN